MASGLLPKSPVSSSLCDEVPHIFIPKSHLEPREFLISSAKRLLQQYLPKSAVSQVSPNDLVSVGEQRGGRVKTCHHMPRVEEPLLSSGADFGLVLWRDGVFSPWRSACRLRHSTAA